MNDKVTLMEGADYQPDAEFTPGRVLQASGGTAVYQLSDDALMNVEFYERRVPVKAKSTDKAIHYAKKVYCKIWRTGDKSTVVDQPVKEDWIRRFPHQYQAFLAGKSQMVGTPVERMMELSLLDKSQVDMVKMSGFNAVEQVAAASNDVLKGWGTDGLEIQKLCKGFVNQKDSIEQKADTADLRKELDESKRLIAELSKKVDTKAGGKTKSPAKKEALVIEE